MSATWDDLRALRQHGMVPAMKLVVTNSPRFAWPFHNIGVMAIVHRSGEPMPVELLDGMEVIFWFEHCGQSEAVLRLMREKGVNAAWYRCWCRCYDELTSLAMPCNEQQQFAIAFDKARAH